MDFQQLLEKYSPFLRRNLLPIALGLFGMIFFIYGLIGLFLANKAASDDIIFETSGKNSVEIKTIFIDIEGAVVRPGLYKLPHDSRIQDALIAAGGVSASADREYMSKNLNLAIRLTDGAKIYIPKDGETESIKGITSIKGSADTGLIIGQININTASESELDSLPGIGPVTAQKIIRGRPYSSVDDLLNKKVVGSKVFSQIRDKITVY